jgi:hypothetical protein
MKKEDMKCFARVFALLTVLCFALPPSVAGAGVAIGNPSGITAGTSGNAVYFGAYEQDNYSSNGKEPVWWRVLENSGGQLFLLSEKNLDAKEYHEDNEPITWERSTIRSWLNGYGSGSHDGSGAMDYSASPSDSFIGTAFGPKEKAAIADTAVNNPNNPNYSTPGGSNTTDKIFFLSIGEATNTSCGFPNNYNPDSSREAFNTAYTESKSHMYSFYTADAWWLRSSGSIVYSAAFVYVDGNVYGNGNFVYNPNVGVRPAVKLNLSSVIFTSAAAGGKLSSVSPNLQSATAPGTGEAVKLTVKDTSLTLTGVAQSSMSGRTIAFDYAGATASETLSAVVTDGAGTVVKYYGQLAVTAATGNTGVTVPDGFAAGDKLQIFVEQVNGGSLTDFASDFVELTLPLAKTEPAGLSGTAPTSAGANDGKITGTTADMEYILKSAYDANPSATWTTCGDPETGSLADGTYLVRTKSDGAEMASKPETVTVGNPPSGTTPPRSSSGGGCDAGFGSGALILLAGLAVARARKHRG